MLSNTSPYCILSASEYNITLKAEVNQTELLCVFDSALSLSQNETFSVSVYSDPFNGGSALPQTQEFNLTIVPEIPIISEYEFTDELSVTVKGKNFYHRDKLYCNMSEYATDDVSETNFEQIEA